MKKIGLGSVAFALIFMLAFCATTFAAGENLKVAMILWRGETIAEKGFKDGLKDLGYSIEYTIMNAGQDRRKLARLLRNKLRVKLKQFDYVYTFGTTVSMATKIIVNSEVPQIFNLVAAPVLSGLVQSQEKSGGNIAGTTSGIPLDLQIQTAMKIVKFKKLGVIYNPREKNSRVIVNMLHRISKKFKIKVVEFKVFQATDNLQKQLQRIIDKKVSVDAVYLPLDSFVVSNAKMIGSALKKAKIISIGSIKKYIELGALMGIVPDYYKLGRAAASILDKHRKGQSLQSMPIYKPNEPMLVINKTTSKLLKVRIPEKIMEKSLLIN